MCNWAMPPLVVAVEELRPDAAYTRLILAAVYDIRLCEEMFDGWMTQLNKCAATRFFGLVVHLTTLTVITVLQSARSQMNENGC
jgi:hypothetical protein